MPRRNLYLLLGITAVSLACYAKADSAYRSRYGQMSETFIEVMKQIDRHYVEPVDERQLFEAALTGMIGQLGDPYSAYEPPRQALEFRQQLDQQFGGIGIEIDPLAKPLTVASPMVDTPAYQAGILPGDRIVAIEGESTEGLDLAAAKDRMRGEPGKPLRLTVLHPGEQAPVELTIVRAIINMPSVLGDRRDAQGRWLFTVGRQPMIGYLRITAFGEQTVDELRAALKALDQQGIEALVIDLRHNFGGMLRAAVATCDMFVKEGVIVSTRGRDKQRNIDVFHASGKANYTRWPIAVLVDHMTASAAEIVAACLQDRGRAVIVGERTWGKGTVQNVIPLEGGNSALKLTVATYWRPSEKNIHRTREAAESDAWGVWPDAGMAVSLSDDELRRMIESRGQRERGFQGSARVQGSGFRVQETDKPREVVGPDDAAEPVVPLFDPCLDKAVEYLNRQITVPAAA
ncbi:MAG TPA: S41 family peptidase [Pirellulales bacterium]|nr:S41 family peptidase [Pirellulales bacterium]